jgi:GH24 family phage-related lysozyme (muramidase)
MTITQEEAENMLRDEMAEYEGYVNNLVTVELNQNQFDAMVSWVYNLGGGNLGASTLLKVLNAGDFAGVPAQMLRWNKAGGKVLEGLTRRRQAEADLFVA